jgi:hypothetical protein
MTLTLNSADVHHIPVSALAGPIADTGQLDVYGVIAVAVVIMLLTFALEWARGLVSALWSMSKLLFAAIGVAIALCAALAVLVGVVVLSTAGG